MEGIAHQLRLAITEHKGKLQQLEKELAVPEFAEYHPVRQRCMENQRLWLITHIRNLEIQLKNRLNLEVQQPFKVGA